MFCAGMQHGTHTLPLCMRTAGASLQHAWCARGWHGCCQGVHVCLGVCECVSLFFVCARGWQGPLFSMPGVHVDGMDVVKVCTCVLVFVSVWECVFESE